MGRTLVLGCAVAGLVAGAQGVGVADEGGGVSGSGGLRNEADPDGEFDIGVQANRSLPAEAIVSGGTPRVVWIAVPTPGNSGDPDDGNQGVCRDVAFVQVDPEEAASTQQRAEADYLFNYGNIPELLGFDPNVPCPVDPADELPAALVEDVVRAVISEQLPRPNLELPPGFALPGLRTYLITDHELTHQLDTTMDLEITQLDVSIDATGTSVIDWGDGTVTEHDHGADRGYPNGPINHVYTDAGTVDITVTDTWTVTYRAGPISGSFSAPLADVVLPDIEVQERRAVRTS